ncbi:hypothetical protein [Microtetraspora niveoalba]|uniref:hypothetical protein n=1 Tax=Microtetraspora niveoalba TaxID=46175 RepID=UPI00082E3BA1|nr:hypothetical protein [Microtetraspora niveoalba]
MNRSVLPAHLAGLLAVAVLLPMSGVLLVMQAMYDNTLLWILSVVTGFTVAVVGVVAGLSIASRKAAADADAARLEELEPLPPAATAEGEPR